MVSPELAAKLAEIRETIDAFDSRAFERAEIDSPAIDALAANLDAIETNAENLSRIVDALAANASEFLRRARDVDQAEVAANVAELELAASVLEARSFLGL